jgi:hypothetical protein
LGTVAAAAIAILGFVVGIFEDAANPDPGSPRATPPVIESLAYVPPSAIDAAGISGPVAEDKAIYLVARRPSSGELVASTTATLSPPVESEDELHWRARLDLHSAALGAQVESSDGPVPYEYEVVAAVMPEPDSSLGGSQPATSMSANASASDPQEVDLDDAEAVSPPRLVTVR